MTRARNNGRSTRLSWLAAAGSLSLAVLSALAGLTLEGGTAENLLFFYAFAALSGQHGLWLLIRRWRRPPRPASPAPLMFGALLYYLVWVLSTVFLFAQGVDPAYAGWVLSCVLFAQASVCMIAYRTESGHHRPNGRGFALSSVQLSWSVGAATWMLVASQERYAAFFVVPFVTAPLLLHAAATVLWMSVAATARATWIPRAGQGLFALYYALLFVFPVWVASQESMSGDVGQLAFVAGVSFLLAVAMTTKRMWSTTAPGESRSP